MRNKTIRRSLSLLCAASCLASAVLVPCQRAYAASAAVSAGSYAINLLLNACGVDVGSLSGISAWVGTWDSYQEYEELGSKGMLGSYSQHLYDMANSEAVEAVRDQYRKDIETLNAIVTASWGEVVEFGSDILSSLRSWLSGFDSYGTGDTVYQKDYSFPDGYEGTYVHRVPYEGTYVPDDTYNYVFSYQNPASADGTVSYTNAYIKDYTVSTLVGVMVSGDLTFFGVNEGSLKSGVSFRTGSLKVKADGTSSKTSNYMSKFPAASLSSSAIHAFPFPVFADLSAASAYVLSGDIGGMVNGGSVGLAADRVIPALQEASVSPSAASVTLPASAEEAASLLDGVQSATDVDAIKEALVAAGLAVGWGAVDVPDVDVSDGSVSKQLTSIIAGITAVKDAVAAIPANIAAFFTVDTAAVGTAFSGLKDALTSRFDALLKIPAMFSDLSVSLDSSVPLITMPIPPSLYPIFDSDRVIVFDLRGYESTCNVVRLFFRALLWFGFGFAVLREFDIEFHVG